MARRIIAEDLVGEAAAVVAALWTLGLVLGAFGSWRLAVWALYPVVLVCAALCWLMYRWPVTRPLIAGLDAAASTMLALLLACASAMRWLVTLAGRSGRDALRVCGRSILLGWQSIRKLLTRASRLGSAIARLAL